MNNKKKLFFSQKLDILNDIKENIPVKVICAKYNVHKSTITRIRNNSDKIYDFAKQTIVPVTKVKRITKVTMHDTEKAVYNWFLNERMKHNTVSDTMLQLKALEFHKELNANVKFEGSHGWVQRFKKRHSIRLFKICGEKVSSNESSVRKFLENFANMVREQNLVTDQIYNADESGLIYKFLSNVTLVSSNEKHAPGRKNSKERITIMACTNANGNHKLPLMLIGKSNNPRCFKNVILPEMHYRASKMLGKHEDYLRNGLLMYSYQK